MRDDNQRDSELDAMLAPLRQSTLNSNELDRILVRSGALGVTSKSWWLPLAFAAGISVGVIGTLLLMKNVGQEVMDSSDAIAFSSEEFATVRQVVTNY